MSDQDRDELVARLDTIIAILQLALKDKLDTARQELLADSVAAAILEQTSADWVESGVLQSQVAAATKQSDRTVRRRIASLLSQHALVQSGTGPRVRYRSTGLI
ncbi:MAG TPA: hypothetical protein VFH48_31870 [Chloroflexota bacterium]|nr:hypothetical protein [Chloroflexota bacterium]